MTWLEKEKREMEMRRKMRRKRKRMRMRMKRKTEMMDEKKATVKRCCRSQKSGEEPRGVC